MGYSAGEIIMVNFIILNSKSLPFRNKYEFEERVIEFLKVINFLSRDKKYYTELRTGSEFKNMILYSNKNILEVMELSYF